MKPLSGAACAFWFVACGTSNVPAHVEADATADTAAVQVAVDPNCGLPGFVTLTLDDTGRTSCAAEGPVWGIADAAPATAQTGADGTLLDTRTGLAWHLQALSGAFNQADAWSACRKSARDGRDDWRLPTVAEALTAVDFSRHNPALGLPLEPTPDQAFWTAVTRGGAGWVLQTSEGQLIRQATTAVASAWCVRTAQPVKTPPMPRFQKSPAGVVKDAWTGLRWQGTAPTTPRTLIYANGWCVKLNIDDLHFRTPSINELVSLLDPERDPPINYVVFAEGGGVMQALTPTAADGSVHWGVDFATGALVHVEGDGEAAVRCIVAD